MKHDPFDLPPLDDPPDYDGWRTVPCEGQVKATRFKWTLQDAIPPRQWLYDRHFIRRFVSVTVAPGGVGKSSLGLPRPWRW